MSEATAMDMTLCVGTRRILLVCSLNNNNRVTVIIIQDVPRGFTQFSRPITTVLINFSWYFLRPISQTKLILNFNEIKCISTIYYYLTFLNLLVFQRPLCYWLDILKKHFFFFKNWDSSFFFYHSLRIICSTKNIISIFKKIFFQNIMSSSDEFVIEKVINHSNKKLLFYKIWVIYILFYIKSFNKLTKTKLFNRTNCRNPHGTACIILYIYKCL